MPKPKINIQSLRWRLNNLYHVVNKKGEDVLLNLNWAQEDLYDNFHYLNVIPKSRQLGMSTFIDILFLDTCLFNDNVSAGIIAHTREDAQEIFKTKIKYPYDNLPQEIKAWRPATTDSARELSFSNGSVIRVGTSMRSGTLNYLHVSEFGKISSKYPDKAHEIVSGSLNTVQAGNYIFIESTAEGRGGYFYDYVKDAERLQLEGKELTTLDFKLHFYPWWKHPEYVLEGVEDFVFTPELIEYFQKLQREEGIELSHDQKVWYAKKKIQQREFIYREFPSTLNEAFLVSNEGFYYSRQFAELRKDGRICNVPHDPATTVDTFWDIGVHDQTCIWFVQKAKRENHVIDYYENCSEGLPHYINLLQRKKDEGYIFRNHWFPHDIQVREFSSGTSRYDTLVNLGIKPKIVGQLQKSGKYTPFLKQDQIEATRNVLSKCWFDEKKCAKGIEGLENYKREWNDKLNCYRDAPLHDWASHPADAFAGVGLFSHKIGGREELITEEEADLMWEKYAMGV